MELSHLYAQTMSLRIAKFRILKEVEHITNSTYVISADHANLPTDSTSFISVERFTARSINREAIEEVETPVDNVFRSAIALDSNSMIPVQNVPRFDPFSLPLRVHPPTGESMTGTVTLADVPTFTGVIAAQQSEPSVTFRSHWFDIFFEDGTMIRARNFAVRESNIEDGDEDEPD